MLLTPLGSLVISCSEPHVDLVYISSLSDAYVGTLHSFKFSLLCQITNHLISPIRNVMKQEGTKRISKASRVLVCGHALFVLLECLRFLAQSCICTISCIFICCIPITNSIFFSFMTVRYQF